MTEQPKPPCPTPFCSRCLPSNPCMDDCHICHRPMTGPEKIRAAIKADRGGDAPTNVQGFA